MLALNYILSAWCDVAFKEGVIDSPGYLVQTNVRMYERTNGQTNERCCDAVRDNCFTRQEVNRFINANNSTSVPGMGQGEGEEEGVGRSKNTYATKLIYGVLTTVFRGNPFISYNTCRAA